MALQASSASASVLKGEPPIVMALVVLMMDRTPRRHEAGSSVKAGTAAALITDHERKAVAAPVPYFHVRDGTNDAGELHGHFIHGASPIREAPEPERKANPDSRRSCGAPNEKISETVSAERRVPKRSLAGDCASSAIGGPYSRAENGIRTVLARHRSGGRTRSDILLHRRASRAGTDYDRCATV